MIFVTDKGRLCNNILQYGHLYAWGREHGKKTISMRFAYKYKEFAISHTKYHNWLVYVLAKYAARCGIIPTVKFNEADGDYRDEEQVMMTKPLVLAKGWFVRYYDLFDKYRDEIVRLFEFSPKVRRRAERRLATTHPDAVRVGVHIRRGDYATWSGGHYYYTDEQYLTTIKQFTQLMNEKKVEVFICGNDPKLDRLYYRRMLGAENVHFPDGKPAEDLCLFSQCDYLIGPPSTFTLVASMYRDTPLHWIVDVNAPLSLDSFQLFSHLYRTFDGLYIPS